jgi:hypothetical protein
MNNDLTKILKLLFLITSLSSCREKTYHANGALKIDLFQTPFSKSSKFWQYDEAGKLLRYVEMHNEVPYGKYIEYYSNGKMSFCGEKSEGNFNGQAYHFFNNGQLSVSVKYKNDEIDGWRYSYDSSTQKVNVIAYYQSGFRHFVQAVNQEGKVQGAPAFYLRVIYDKDSYSKGDTIKCTLLFPLDSLRLYSEGFKYLWGQAQTKSQVTPQFAAENAFMEKPITKDTMYQKFVVESDNRLVDYFVMVYEVGNHKYVCPVDGQMIFETQSN